MLNVNQKEKKCVRYLANEMSQAERSVFEIELSLDDNLLVVFENFQTIWISYPISELPKQTISFEEILARSSKSKRVKSVKVSIKIKAVLSMAFLLVFGLGLSFRFRPQRAAYAIHA